jgi:hypothetical protein
MGFLDGLRDVLGGFNDVKQIDQNGFEFRELRDQAEWQRQRQRQLAQQQDETRDLGMAEDVLVGGGSEGDIQPFLQSVDPSRRGAIDSLLKGKAGERKSAIEDRKNINALTIQQLRGGQKLDEIDARADAAQALARVKADLEAGRQPSPRDLALIQERGKVQEGLFNRAEAGRNARFERGLTGRPQRVQTTDENGNAVWGWVTPGQQGVPLAPTAIERQVSGMADTVRGNVGEMAKLAPDVVSGPISGRISKASQALLGPHGKEGEFDFDANAVIDTVYVKSGKQINDTEMKILRQMVPDRSRGNLEEQVRLFGEYANSLLQKYGGKGGGGSATTPPRPPGVPEGARFDPVTRRWRL